MRIRYTRPALIDLKNLIAYIDAQATKVGQQVRSRIKSAIGRLADHPRIGKQTDDPTVRRLTTAPYPYLIFYEATGTEIIIHAVRHGTRDPSSMPDAS